MAKIRYTRQYDRYGCAPVAIANALKWAGVCFSFKTHKHHFYKTCRTDRDGTTTWNIQYALYALCHRYLSYEKKSIFTLEDLANHLNHPQGAIILEIDDDPDDNYTHVTLLTRATPKMYFFYGINYDYDVTVSKISKKELERAIFLPTSKIDQKRYNVGPAFFLTKRKYPLPGISPCWATKELLATG